MEEKPYTADLSLRLVHEDRDLRSICEALELQPRIIWKKGDDNVTPAGNPFAGVRLDSYCSIDLEIGSDQRLKQQIEMALAMLEPHDAALREFHLDGGRILLVIGWFCNMHTGATLDASVVERLSRLHIGLDIHVYVPDPADDDSTGSDQQ